MKIALLNVRYSPNLGDGLLSECLEAELARHLPAATFVTLDLAGRTGYGSPSPWRRPAMAVLMLVPQKVRRIAAKAALGRLMKRLGPQFSRTLADCDAAVLGGGNLLADADLNFPIKISGAIDAASRTTPAGLPTAVFAVGVSHNWSVEGAALFTRALEAPSVIAISVRDELSYDALVAQAPVATNRNPRIVRDPGLLAVRHFSREPHADKAPIGLCITDPLLLRYHGGEASAPELEAWFGDLAEALVAAGHDILLFTNGSAEDKAFLARNAERWRGRDVDRIRLAPAARTPADLVGIIAQCSVVVAHRMHACIAAHSFAIPTIALRWDPKLDAFMALAGRSGYLHVAGRTPAADVARSVETALAEGVDPTAHAALIADAENDVATLAATLRGAIST